MYYVEKYLCAHHISFCHLLVNVKFSKSNFLFRVPCQLNINVSSIKSKNTIH
jgi:hypothetical protein